MAILHSFVVTGPIGGKWANQCDIGTGQDEIVIGGASYSVIDRDAQGRIAELAFTVEENFQNRGVASLLMRHFIAIARTKGITQLEADVLAVNRSMLSVFRRCGLPMVERREADLVHVVLSLESAGSVPPNSAGSRSSPAVSYDATDGGPCLMFRSDFRTWQPAHTAKPLLRVTEQVGIERAHYPPSPGDATE